MSSELSEVEVKQEIEEEFKKEIRRKRDLRRTPLVVRLTNHEDEILKSMVEKLKKLYRDANKSEIIRDALLILHKNFEKYILLKAEDRSLGVEK